MSVSLEQPMRPYLKALGESLDNTDASVAQLAQDLQALDGELDDTNTEVGAIAQNVQGLQRQLYNIPFEYVRTYDTVADMQADDNLLSGMVCHTNGFNTSGDGGAAYYTVGASGDIALQGGLYATVVPDVQTVTRDLPYTILPTVIGRDWYYRDADSNTQFASCAAYNNTLYGYVTHGVNDEGEGRIYNLSTGAYSIVQNVNAGHGNSMAYIPELNALAITVFSTATVTSDARILLYDTSFSLLSTITAPRVYHGISYDFATSKLYGYTVELVSGSNSKRTIVVYELDTTTLAEIGVTRVAYDNYPFRFFDVHTSQDFAVYDNVFYLYEPHGLGLAFRLDIDDKTPFRLSDIDRSGTFRLQEFEGSGFDEDGNWICYCTQSCYNVEVGMILSLAGDKYARELYLYAQHNIKLDLRVPTNNIYRPVTDIYWLEEAMTYTDNCVNVQVQPATYNPYDGKAIVRTIVLQNVTGVHLAGTNQAVTLPQIRIFGGIKDFVLALRRNTETLNFLVNEKFDSATTGAISIYNNPATVRISNSGTISFTNNTDLDDSKVGLIFTTTIVDAVSSIIGLLGTMTFQAWNASRYTGAPAAFSLLMDNQIVNLVSR